MSEYYEFKKKCIQNILEQSKDLELLEAQKSFFRKSFAYKYSYNFEFLGRPIIQYPQDIVALQELIFEVKPDLIIETGIAHGGSLIMSASMLALLDICDAIHSGVMFNPQESNRKVIGIDVDIRSHNRVAIELHPMASRIQMIQGSSICDSVIQVVRQEASKYDRVMVCLDSNHTHDHVLAELQAYAPLTSIGSYCVVFDTIVEDMPADAFSDRSWGPGNNPKTAVWEYLKMHPEFHSDTLMQQRLLITVAPDGYLKRIK